MHGHQSCVWAGRRNAPGCLSSSLLACHRLCQTLPVHGGPAGEARRPVGRSAELEIVVPPLVAGSSHVMITAGPGLGSTSLACYAAAVSSRPVRIVYADPATRQIALAALAPVVSAPDTVLGNGPDMLARVIARLVPDPERPPVVVVDQAPDLDDLSAMALAQATQKGLTLVLTSGRRPVLSSALASLVRSQPVTAIDLAPIDDASVSRLAAETLGATIDPALVRALTRHVGGAPAAIVDVLTDALTKRLIVRDGSVWKPRAPLTVPTVLSIRAARALEGVSTGTTAVAVDLLAVGGTVPRDVLAVAAGTDALDSLDTHSLVDHLENGALRLADPLIRTVRLASLSVGRRRELVRLLDGALADADARDALLDVRLALYRDQPPAPAQLLEGARLAWQQGEIELAEALCRAAHDAGSLQATLVLGELLTTLGRAREAETLLSAVVTDEPDAIALAQQTRAVNFAYHLDDVDGAFLVLDDALIRLAGTPWSAELIGLKGVITTMQGRPAEALAMVEPFLTAGSGRHFCEAATAAGPSLVVLGRPLQAADLALRALDERTRLGDEPLLASPGLHVLIRSFGLAEAGRFADADHLAGQVMDSALSRGDREGQMWAGIMVGRSLLNQGRYDDALLVFEAAATAATDVGLIPHLGWARGGALLAAAQMRDVVATRHCLDALEACPATRLAMMAPDIMRARAWALVAEGDLRRAVDTLVGAADLARDSGAALLEMLSLYDLLRLGHRSEVSRLLALAELVEGELPACRADHARALQAGDVDGLARVSSRLEELGALVLAAEAANQAAWACRRAGASAKADRLRTRVVQLRSRRPRASTPGLDLRPGAALLTAREREIAELAAAGWPSKHISAHLGVSVRTVDNLLQRVYRKLDVRGRADLRADVLR